MKCLDSCQSKIRRRDLAALRGIKERAHDCSPHLVKSSSGRTHHRPRFVFLCSLLLGVWYWIDLEEKAVTAKGPSPFLDFWIKEELLLGTTTFHLEF